MEQADVIALIQQELPRLIAQDSLVRDFILRTVSEYYASKPETESKFDRVLAELQRDREEQARRWDELNHEQNRKWDEQNQRWEEQNRKWDELNHEQSRKWDEQNQRWEEQNRKWDELNHEQNRKWDEQNQRWEEQNRKWDELNHEQSRKWDEQNQRWEEQNHEQNRKWDEQNQRWEEQNRKWDELNHEQNRKWDEQNQRWDELNHEQNRKWDEQNQRWEEQNRKWDEQLAEIRRLDKRFDGTIGALGSRWGLASEASFRNALQGILGESFGVQVLNLTLYDHAGEVFGAPDQVELDIIIKNGTTIACEIKSSIDKAGMYSFGRKVDFYARHENREVSRKIVISPMVDSRALPVAEALGIEIYSYADAVQGL